jgi:hypothetical protein
MLITNIFKPLPIIKTTAWKMTLISLFPVSLGIFLPWFTHQYGIAGQVFLPMHFFVLTSALILGWRAGLFIGILTPLASYAISGMPPLPSLPQIALEVTAYGLIAGLLREKVNMNYWSALLSAMVGGRIALLIAVWLITSLNPFTYLWQAVSLGWPGMLIQLALVPLGVKGLTGFLRKI